MAVKRPTLKDKLARDNLFQTSADLPRLVELDVATIAPNPDQPRQAIDAESLEGLKLSIERQGVLQPILVRQTEVGWVLVAGQRRLAAVRALGRPTIAAIITAGDPLEIALVENLQRAELDPFDEAVALRKLMEKHAWTQAQLGEALGRKQSTISQTLALERLPDRIRNEYPTSDNISRSLLIELAQTGNAETQLLLWDTARQGKLTVRGLRDERHGHRTSRAEGASIDSARSLKRFVSAGERLLKDFSQIKEGTMPDVKPVIERLRPLYTMLGQILDRYPDSGENPSPRRKSSG